MNNNAYGQCGKKKFTLWQSQEHTVVEVVEPRIVFLESYIVLSDRALLDGNRDACRCIMIKLTKK